MSPFKKTQFYQLTSNLRKKLCEYSNQNWLSFIEKWVKIYYQLGRSGAKLISFEQKKEFKKKPTLFDIN